MVGATSRRDFPVLSVVNLLRIGWGFAEQLVVRQKNTTNWTRTAQTELTTSAALQPRIHRVK